MARFRSEPPTPQVQSERPSKPGSEPRTVSELHFEVIATDAAGAYARAVQVCRQFFGVDQVLEYRLRAVSATVDTLNMNAAGAVGVMMFRCEFHARLEQ